MGENGTNNYGLDIGNMTNSIVFVIELIRNVYDRSN